MRKIDTSGWKEFRIGDLFEACLSKDDIQPKDFVEGKIPLVSSGKENNGIIAFVEDKKARLWEANTLTIDMFGKVFYQENPYFAVSHGRVNILLPKISMTKGCLQFMGCAIEKVTLQKYAFNEMCTGTKVLKDNIKLPATPDGAPDWAYMESYMANLETKVAESMTLLQAAKNAEKKKVDTREWGEFRVGELFDIKHPAARSEKKYCEGEINYVSSGAFNNGVANKLMPLPNELLDRGGCITVSPLDGSSFYQEEDFLGRGGSGASISILYNSHLNRNNALFICSVIRSSANGFGYTDLLNGENLKSLTIKLPVDKTGQPDWEYMEEYMRKVEKKANDVLNFLDRISTRRKIDGV